MKPQTFASFEEYSAALRHTTFRVTSLGRQRKPWTLAHLQLEQLSIQWGQDGGAILFEGALHAAGVVLVVPLDAANVLSGNGVVLDESSIMLIVPGAEYCAVALDATPWASIFIPFHALDGIAPATSCEVIRAEDEVRLVRATLKRVIAAAEVDAFVADSPAKTAAAGELLHHVRPLLCLPAVHDSSHGRHRIPRGEIIRRAKRLLDEHIGETVSVDDLAAVADVSTRTLRTAFHEQFGLSPTRYLRLRALNQARRDLQSANPDVTRVTDVAVRLGIWEWGRFSHDYHVLFGELPSQTLHHRPLHASCGSR